MWALLVLCLKYEGIISYCRCIATYLFSKTVLQMTSLTPGFVILSMLSWCRFHEASRQHLTPFLSYVNTSSTIGLWEYAASKSNISFKGAVANPLGKVKGNLIGIDKLFLCGDLGLLDTPFGIVSLRAASAHPFTCPLVKCWTLSLFRSSRLKCVFTVPNLIISIPRTFIRSSRDLNGPLLFL